MSGTSTNDPPEPPSTRPGRPAARGEIRRRLQQLFPDLDPDVVAEVLGFSGTDELTEQGER